MAEDEKEPDEMKGWKFGVGQSKEDEEKEIRDARRQGLEREYVAGQRWARMIEAETDRRRTRKRLSRLGAGK